jgi:hypothetical protein
MRRVFTELAEELQSFLAAGQGGRAHQILEQLLVLVSRIKKGMQAADDQSEPVATRANGA